MKMRKHLPVNLTVMAVAALLWQAEAQAKDGKVQVRSRSKGVVKWSSKRRLGVLKRRQRRAVMSRMRERARIYEPYMIAAAQKHGVDPRLLWTIAFLETRFRPELVSPMKARGLMQFMPETARRFNLSNPHDSRAAIDAAARYVKQLASQFDGRLDLVLAGYNAGEGAVDAYRTGRSLRTSRGKVINRRGIKTNGVPPYRETIAYVKRGLLVFNRVASAGVFSPEVVATVRILQVPSMPGSAADQLLMDRELRALMTDRVFPTLLYSALRQVEIKGNETARARSVNEPESREFETVFFDVHSGVRYLVSRGEIVKPLERIDGVEAAGNGGESGHHVSKSYYFGTGGY
jgi:transglycosylase-like protein with SLT domain